MGGCDGFPDVAPVGWDSRGPVGVSACGVGVGGLGQVLFRVFRAVRAPVRRVTQGWWLA